MMRSGSGAVISVQKLGFVFETLDPFLFCVHHRDAFPGSQDGKVPERLLAGRDIGQDFAVKDGFRMYHGEHGVPGFPAHPHYGFETVTIVREGIVDHFDSLGATARFGGGGSDTQWVTCGNGMQHSEMMPLVSKEKNPLELFQIWLNLPAASKQVSPYFTMLWSEKNPVLSLVPGCKVTVIADEAKQWSDKVQTAPPDSWASRPGSAVAILLIELDSGAEYTIDPSAAGVNRKLFLYSGPANGVTIGEVALRDLEGAVLDSTKSAVVKNDGNKKAEFLMLQAKPIGEPVVQNGPFVAITNQEMNGVFQRYQRTQFGGWPWPGRDLNHALDKPRFARFVDGHEEYPDQAPLKEEL